MQTNQFDSLTELNKFYNREKDRLERIERMCVHDWSSPVDDPYTISEGYGYKSVVQGSDVWGEYEGYHTVTKHRWKRVCNDCGRVEYTDKVGTKTISTGPDFS